MRAGTINLPNDATNTGKRHAALTRGAAETVTYVPRVSDLNDPGVLQSEFTLRVIWTNTVAARLALLVNMPGSGVDVLATVVRAKFLVTTAQALSTWQAYVYNLNGVGISNDFATAAAVGRGEARSRKSVVSVEALATMPSPAAIVKTVPFFREALPVTGTAAPREIALIETGAPPIWLAEGQALALDLKPAPALSQYEIQLTFGWQEWAL